MNNAPASLVSRREFVSRLALAGAALPLAATLAPAQTEKGAKKKGGGAAAAIAAVVRSIQLSQS